MFIHLLFPSLRDHCNTQYLLAKHENAYESPKGGNNMVPTWQQPFFGSSLFPVGLLGQMRNLESQFLYLSVVLENLGNGHCKYGCSIGHASSRVHTV